MTTVNAVPSDAAANSYLTLEEADLLMEGFSEQDAWDELDADAQGQLLLEGTRAIDQYKNWGPVKVDGQRLAFPRSTDAPGLIPENVRLALAEYVNYKVEGNLEPLKKLQAEGVTSASILGQSSNFAADLSGLPAGSRRHLDRTWAAYWPVSSANPGKCPDVSFYP